MYKDTTTTTDCLPILNAAGFTIPFGPLSLPVQVWINPTSGRSEFFVVEVERTPEGYRRLVQQTVLYRPGARSPVLRTATKRPDTAFRPGGESGRQRALLFVLAWLLSITLLLAFFSLLRWPAS